MRTLLVLGAKPEPALPPPGMVDAVACANASGRSAADRGLPEPLFTVMTALLTDGSAAGRSRIEAVRGLGTGRLVYYPRPDAKGGAFKRLRHAWRTRSQRPEVLLRELGAVGYRHASFEKRAMADFARLILERAGREPEVEAALARKQASSGALAVALAIAEPGFDRVVVAGFSFELTQAFGFDPNIALRGTAASKHRDTDVTVLAALARHHPLFTTEPAVHDQADVPLLPESATCAVRPED